MSEAIEFIQNNISAFDLVVFLITIYSMAQCALIQKKGVITLGETSVGDGIYKSETIFRQEPNIYHMNQSLYTTCDHDAWYMYLW